MAPGLMTTSAPVPSHQLNGHSPSTPSNSPQLDRKLFPDGLKTSGQHAAVESLLFPYSEFPKYVDGPTMWRAEKYRDNPEKWTHPFTEYEVAELSAVADRFIESGIPLTGMARVSGTRSSNRSRLIVSGTLPPPNPRPLPLLTERDHPRRPGIRALQEPPGHRMGPT